MEVDLPYSAWDDHQIEVLLDMMKVSNKCIKVPEDVYWRARAMLLDFPVNADEEVYWKGYRLYYYGP